MASHLKITKSLGTFLGGLSLLALLLSSCLKENKSTYVPPPVALVTFIQASPDEPAMDFYLDNNKVLFSGPINYGNNVDYFRAYPGKRTATFYNVGTTAKIFLDTVTFNANFAYSLFLANKPSSPELVKLVDSISKPATGKVNIRFINLSPDAPAVDLVIKGGSVLVSKKLYKGHSSFLAVPGETTYTLEVHQSGTGTVLATLPSTNLKSGFVYTVWFHGLANAQNGNDGLKVDILTNAFYF